MPVARAAVTSRIISPALAACLLLIVVYGSPASAGDPVTPQASATPRTSTPKLDLSLGDLTVFFDPDELARPVPADDLEEIIVNGQRPEPLPEERVIPQNLGALFYSVSHPLQAWRILVPDLNREIPERSIDDVREPPGAFRGKILEPGAIYD